MKIATILDRLEADAGRFPAERRTCDTIKYGSAERDASKVAVTMFPTPDVIRAAADWGAELLVTHEPTAFDRVDGEKVVERDAVSSAKERLILEKGLTIYRFHDHPHVHSPDWIDQGFLEQLDLEMQPAGFQGTAYPLSRFILSKPITPRALAKRLHDRMGIGAPRVAGAADTPCTHLTLALGQRGYIIRELCDPFSEIVIAGECSEWQQGEYARDAAQLGIAKALVFAGHSGSERPGMAFVAKKLAALAPEVEVRYFDCGDTYGLMA